MSWKEKGNERKKSRKSEKKGKKSSEGDQREVYKCKKLKNQMKGQKILRKTRFK